MTKERIDACFAKLKEEKKGALVTYIMGYDPDRETSAKLLEALPAAGADIIELGMPFSDPMADGPTIEESANRALKTGATIKKVLELLKEFRSSNQETPVILMGYYNPIYKYGVEGFVKDAIDAGADGVIIVDLPPEEEGEFTEHAHPAGLALVKLTTPTTNEERAKVVLKEATGFVYYVSIAGITGTKSAERAEIEKAVTMLKGQTDLPIVVGFGIKTGKQVGEILEFSHGAVVGSAIVNKVKENAGDIEATVKEVSALVAELAKGKSAA